MLPIVKGKLREVKGEVDKPSFLNFLKLPPDSLDLVRC
jgi:hypothetical protein